MSEIYFTKEHEWIKVDGDEGIVGITDYAQNELGDIVYIDLPELEIESEKGQSLGQVESVKAVSDIYFPVSGTVMEVNEELEDTPELINESPMDKGWIAKINILDKKELDDLMSQSKYKEFVAE